MVSFRGCGKQPSCDICGKEFYLKWRLEQHLSVLDKSVKICKYFNDRIDCPFNDIGCKFSHDDQVEDESIDDVNPKYDYYCTFCYSKFETQNDLIVHMRDVHTHRPISTYPATE
jgi:uncharacterized Zn-finger protein